MKRLSTLAVMLSMLLPTLAAAQGGDWSDLKRKGGMSFEPADAITQIGGSEARERPQNVAPPREITRASKLLAPARAICGRNNVTVKRDRNGSFIACDGCPDGASAQNGSLRVQKGYAGSFSAVDAEELLLATSGCGGGFNFRNSAVLLRKVEGDWKVVEYKGAFFIDRCTPVASGENAALICLHNEFGQGSSQTYINLVSADEEGIKWTTLGELNDGSGGCYYTPKFVEDGVYKRELEELLIEDIDGDGRTEVAILYTAHHAEVLTQPEPGSRCDESNYNFTSAPKAWVLEIDGHRYRANPGGLKNVEAEAVEEHFEP